MATRIISTNDGRLFRVIDDGAGTEAAYHAAPVKFDRTVPLGFRDTSASRLIRRAGCTLRCIVEEAA